MFHDTHATGAIHIPYNWLFADQAEREAYADATAADVGKLARQEDDNTLWMLTDESGPTWVQIGGTGNDTWVTAPASASAPGIAGQRAYDSDGFIYVCIATDTWVRIAGASW